MVATTDPTSLGRFGLVQPIVETTMAVYADLTALDLRGAVERAAGAVVAPRAAARSG